MVLVGTGGEEVAPFGVLEEVEGAVRVLDAAHIVRGCGVFAGPGFLAQLGACRVVAVLHIIAIGQVYLLGQVQVVVGDAGDVFVFVHGHIAIRIVKVVITTNWCKWRSGSSRCSFHCMVAIFICIARK